MSFQITNGGRLIPNPAPAAVLARVMAKPPQDGRQRQSAAGGGDSFI
jgi:hypothetical protein